MRPDRSAPHPSANGLMLSISIRRREPQCRSLAVDVAAATSAARRFVAEGRCAAPQYGGRDSRVARRCRWRSDAATTSLRGLSPPWRGSHSERDASLPPKRGCAAHAHPWLVRRRLTMSMPLQRRSSTAVRCRTPAPPFVSLLRRRIVRFRVVGWQPLLAGTPPATTCYSGVALKNVRGYP